MNKGKLLQKDKSLVDYYINSQGFMVFTKEYHLKRGYCCKNKCQNCPFIKEMVNNDFEL